MNKTVLFVLLGLAVGVFVGNFMSASEGEEQASEGEKSAVSTDTRPTQQETRAHSSFGVETRLSELQRRLDREVRARRQLETDLRETRRQLAQLADRLQVAPGVPNESDRDADDEAGPQDSDRAWFDEQALLDGGMESTLAGELRLFFEQLEMERLMLRDRSARENWATLRD